MVLNAIFNIISDISWEATAPIYAFLEVLLTSTPQNILSNSLATFPRNHCRNKAQLRERNKSCHNDHYQSRERNWPSQGSNQPPPFLRSCMLSTEPHGPSCSMVSFDIHFDLQCYTISC